MSKYLLKPALKTAKQAFYLEDENGNNVYEGKMTKFKLFGASPFDFENHLTNTKVEHSIGKTVTFEDTSSGIDIVNFLAKRSYFKYDGIKIWDYLHGQGVRIDSTMSGNKLGMNYRVSFRGNPIATITTSSPKGRSLISTDMYYDIICSDDDLDLVFLVAFAIAKTEQTFYN